ncbi:hypothetical protein Q8A67_014941 [Cirrhinus molitorella]|uniref:Transmembrane protein n=1 Tax=Cirrhinus molitorella TaxID=172907 RepID=A0AA88PMG8_9TELE|nr:hypothetical protein Q8A67_014941 [Cirrhinus molitorella]
MESLNAVELRELGDGSRRELPQASSGPAGIENASFEDEDQGTRIRVTSKTSGPEFTSVDSHSTPLPIQREVPSPRSEDEPELEYNGHSVDYGFIFALIFLVSGIILVVIAYTIPREAKVNPDQVTARQMEKLEMYYAQLGELYRRRTFARRPMKSYGSINMRMRQLAEGDGRETLVECEPNATADVANGNQVPSGTLNT